MTKLRATEQLRCRRRYVRKSVIGIRFIGRLLREEQMGDQLIVIPQTASQASVTRFHPLIVNSRHPLKLRFGLSSGGT